MSEAYLRKQIAKRVEREKKLLAKEAASKTNTTAPPQKE